MKPEEYIADLYELKKSLMRPLSYESRACAEPNITYIVIETLIAVLFDKYKADHRLVSEILRDREMAKQVPPHNQTED